MGRIIQRIGSPKVDTGDKLSFKVRALDLKINGSDIHSPIRAVNQQEMSYKAELPSEIPIDTSIGLMDVRIGNKKINSFLTDNGYVSRLIGRLQTAYPMFTHFPFQGVMIQPSDEANAELSNDIKLRNKFYRLSWQMAQFANFNAYILPFLNSPVNELESVTKKFLENNSESDKEIILSIDPSYKNLKELLKFIDDSLVKTKTISCIAILNRSLRYNLVSYDDIWETFHDSRIMMFDIGVKRRMSDYFELSGPHLESFYVGDAFSLRTVKGFSNKGEDEKKGMRPQIPVEMTTRFFSKKNLTVKLFSDILHSTNNFHNFVDEIISDFDKTGYKDREYIERSLNNWNVINNEKNESMRAKKTRIFSALSKVHEVVSSNKEFSVAQEYIRKNEAEDYVKQQPILRKVFSSKLSAFLSK
jgi:hypothetical protein